jgi:hypothetical protein
MFENEDNTVVVENNQSAAQTTEPTEKASAQAAKPVQKAEVKKDKSKGQKIKEELAKAKAKKSKVSKKSGGTRHCIDSVTFEMIQRPGGATLDEIHQQVCKEFGKGHKKDVLLDTTRRRLHGYLQAKYGITIVKGDDGKYHAKTERVHKASA